MSFIKGTENDLPEHKRQDFIYFEPSVSNKIRFEWLPALKNNAAAGYEGPVKKKKAF